MYCRGGYSCCMKGYANQCGEGDGDCNEDEDCEGSMICGNNNCNKWRALTGLWDSKDDCCERRCTAEHPCTEGEGHCETDADCQNPGWLKCGDDMCLDQTYFPRNIFTNNSETYLYNTSDNCCYRPCSSRYKLCSEGEIGCLTNGDCVAGHYCKKDAAQPYCTDIDECEVDNGRFEGSLYCGDHAVCANTVGSFTCTCNTGYTDFQPHAGCIDIDECSTGQTNCGSNTDCWNTAGSYLCACKVGYTGDQSRCSDVNECLDPSSTSCSSRYNLEISGKTNVWQKIQEFDLKNGTLHTFRFSLISTERIALFIGTWNDHYQMRNFKDHLVITGKTGSGAKVLFSKTLPEEATVHAENYISYFFTFQLLDNVMNINFGINANKIIFQDIKDTEAKISTMSIINLITFTGSDYQYAYLRNAGFGSSSCVNTIGSYYCWDDDSLEKVAITFGGHSTSGSVYPPEFTVIRRDKVVCSSTPIDDVSGRYAPGRLM